MAGNPIALHRTCDACLRPIYDQYSFRIDPDLHYHAACLCCYECGRTLVSDATCCIRDGRLFCRHDYTRIFSVRCSRCGTELKKNDYVIRSNNKTYHRDCFSCCACSRILSIGEQYVLHGEEPLCRADSDLLSHLPPLGMLTPTDCETKTAEYGMPDGLLGITLSDATNKHLLVASDAASSSADSIGIGSPTSSSHAACFPDSPCSQTGSSDFCAPTPKASSRHQHQQNVNMNASANTNANGCSPMAGTRSSKKNRKAQNCGGEKSSRIRTVLSDYQLHTLRAYYAANPRPDALLKDKLVAMTGLSPRVIRVWFQNKRCKDKKRSVLLKQLREQEQNGGRQHSELLYATPMIASTPVIYDASSSDCSVDVQPYCFAIANAAC